MLWNHGDINPWEKPYTSNAKTDLWLVSAGKSRAKGHMDFFML